MNFAADLSALFWIIIFAVGMFCVFAPLLARGRLAAKLEKLFSLVTKPVGIVASLSRIKYDIPDVNLACQIIQSWFPHDETESIANAPAPVCGRLTKTVNYNTGAGQVVLQLFYDILLPNSNFVIARRTGTLTCNLRGDLALKQVEIEFVWDGAEHALKDIFSADYQVLHYLLDRIKSEYFCRGFTEIGGASQSRPAESPAKRPVGRQVKQWWRTYSGGAQEQKVYAFWPAPQDYSEAVQSPLVNFKDEGLKKCLPALNTLGIPRVTSGMFASVYQLTGGDEQWAVRCFDTRLIDQQERYKAISSFILSDDLTYTVDFHYLEDGIKCGDTWFPVLKMTWVEGVPLDSYVRENCQNSALLLKLRWEFQIMMEKLRKNGVAHGDLQHGNILVSEGEIYLVDYDAFYVPELAGRHSNELGHANYQHPTRSAKYFGPYMDDFSAFVIDFSLLALIEDPSLLERFNGGDECLLFRKADFVNPDSSRLIAALTRHESDSIRAGVQKLLAYLKMPLEEIPYLESDRPTNIGLAGAELQPGMEKRPAARRPPESLS
jgi:hypothetical protein